MTQPVKITLPWPPSVNHYKGMRVAGKPPKQFVQVYSTDAAKEFHKAAKKACEAQKVAGKHMSGKLAVKITVHPPNRQKRDLDNLPKAIQDTLTMADVWGDDSQVKDLRIIHGAV